MILAPELAVAYFNSLVRIADLLRLPHDTNLPSAELAPVSSDRGAEVMPLFEKCGLVSGADVKCEDYNLGSFNFSSFTSKV